MEKNAWQEELLGKLESFPAQKYHKVMLDLFKAAGYTNIHDIESTDDTLRFKGFHQHGLFPCLSVILCLRNKGMLQRSLVTRFLARFEVKLDHRVCGMLVTTGNVSRDVEELSARETFGKHLILSGPMLCDALVENGIVNLRDETAN